MASFETSNCNFEVFSLQCSKYLRHKCLSLLERHPCYSLRKPIIVKSIFVGLEYMKQVGPRLTVTEASILISGPDSFCKCLDARRTWTVRLTPPATGAYLNRFINEDLLHIDVG